ncbi:MAG: methyltransferase domain-containing protein [Candidatus Altiarchaeota archaeon]|nr:methyltransferase domain-containing protein [Candidatus Altiarchaeota archaeon]
MSQQASGSRWPARRELNIIERPLAEEIDAMLRPKLAEDRSKGFNSTHGYLVEDGYFREVGREVYTELASRIASGGRPVLLVAGPGNARDCFAVKFLYGEKAYVVGADVREYDAVSRRSEMSMKVRDRWWFTLVPPRLESMLWTDAETLSNKSKQSIPGLPTEDELRGLIGKWLKRARRDRVIPDFDKFVMKSVEDFVIPQQVDLVVSNMVLYDTNNPPRALENMLNSLSPGGRMLVDHDDIMHTVFTWDQIHDIERKAVGSFVPSGSMDDVQNAIGVACAKATLDSQLVKSVRTQGFKVELVVDAKESNLPAVESSDQVKRLNLPYFRITSPEKPVTLNLRQFYRLDIL